MIDFKKYENYQSHLGKNILCIDYGDKVIGLASFCPGRDPYPLSHGRIINKGFNNFLKELENIINEEFFEVLIFGIPFLTDGTATDKTTEMKKLFKIIKERFPDLNTIEQDETLTTFSAKERMENSPEFNFKVDLKKIDEVSAIIILEDYIRSK